MSQKPGFQLLVVGGRQRKRALDLDEWHAYDRGVIVAIDPETGSSRTVVEYQTPAEFCADRDPSIVFKAGDLRQEAGRIIVCTQTEILEYDLDLWKPTYFFSHPGFNDLHHVCYEEDLAENREEHLLVANTGLDQVLRIQLDRSEPANSRVVQEWSTCDRETWSRFDRTVDYRKVPTTKPHLSHPNFVFQTQGNRYATRFHQQDALNLDHPDKRIDVPGGNPHDGIVSGDQVAFTTTNGHIVFCNRTTGQSVRSYDLTKMSGTIGSDSGELGWCRGLCLEGPARAWVGFSRIRPTWLRKNLSWIKQGFQARGQYGTQPTRVALYDLEKSETLVEIDLEASGLNAVFGIYRWQTG